MQIGATSHLNAGNAFILFLQAGEEDGGEETSEVNVSYLKLCRLGSGDLSRRFGRGLAWLRLEMKRTDEGREAASGNMVRECFVLVFFNLR